MALVLNPAYFLALSQLSLILSKTLSESSAVFGQLAADTRDDYERSKAPPGLTPVAPAPTERIAAAMDEVTAAMDADPLPPAPVVEAPEPLQLKLQEPPAAPPVESKASSGPDVVPIEQAAQALEISPAVIYALINKELVKKLNPLGKKPYVSKIEVAAAMKVARTRRRKPLPQGLLTPIQAAAALGISSQQLYLSIASGQFKGAIKESNRIKIPAAAVAAFKRENGMLSPEEVAAEPPKSGATSGGATNGGSTSSSGAESSESVATAAAEAPVEEEQTPLEVTLEEQLRTFLATIDEEVQQLEQYLESMQPEMRASQIGIWAGNLRKLLQNADDLPTGPARGEMKNRTFNFLVKLRNLAEKYQVWANALMTEWDIEDWNLYIRSLSTIPQEFSPEEQEVLVEGDLRAILLKPRRPTEKMVRDAIERGLKVLPENNQTLHRVMKLFRLGIHEPPAPPVVEKPVEEPPPPPVESDVPANVLELTAGKRMLIVGGQGERDENIDRFTEQLKLASCEWVTHEKGKAQQLNRIQTRLTPKNYDLMLYMTRFTGHASMKLLTTARQHRLPVVMCTKGYGVVGIANAIAEQYSGPLPPLIRKGTKRPVERRAHA